MAQLGTAYVDVQGDFTKLEAGAAASAARVHRDFSSQMRDVGAGSFDKFNAGAIAAGSRIKYVGSQMSSFGQTMTTRVTAPLAVAGFGMYKAVQLASDLNETINKTKRVFGESGQAMLNWGKNAATTMGMTQQQALEGASSIGAMLTPMGIAPSKAAAMSKAMTQLATDMGSFNNMDPTEMLDRIRSGLSGEMEPLKRFGTVLSETRVKQFAWTNGIAKSGEELTEQQKIMARYGLLLEDTKQQQGDFAKTSDGLANRQRILKANLLESATALGTSLVPILETVVGVLTSTVIPIITKLARAFTNLPSGVKTFVIVMATVAAVMGPTIWAMGAMVSSVGTLIAAYGKAAIVMGNFVKVLGFTRAGVLAGIVVQKVAAAATKAWAAVQAVFNAIMAANPIVLVVLAIAALVAVLVLAYHKSDTFRAIVDKVWDAITNVAEVIWSVLKPAIEVVLGIWLTYIKFVFNLWKTLAVTVFGVVKKIYNVLKSVLGPVVTWIWERFKTAFNNIKTTVVSVFNFVSGVVGKFINVGRKIGRGLLNAIKSALGGLGSMIGSIVQSALRGLEGIVNGAIDALNKVIDGINKVKVGEDIGHVGHVDFAARGMSSAPGGLTMVGERGPELVNLPRGAQVYTAGQTARILGGGAAPLGAPTAPEVRVFIGDQELTHIVRTEIGHKERAGRLAYRTGVLG
jgi:phage-related protein